MKKTGKEMDNFIDNDLHQAAVRNKLNFYFKNKIKVHILKFNKTFLNGVLIEKINNEIYVIDDLKGEQKIFISEIYEVEEFKEAPEKGDDNG